MGTPDFEVMRTSAWPEEQRSRAWWEHNARALVSLSPLEEQGSDGAAGPLAEPRLLDGVELTLALGEARLGRVAANAHALRRDSSDIASHPAGAVFIALVRGSGLIHTRSGSLRLKSGEAVLLDGDAPFAREFSGPFEEYVAAVPRAWLSGAGANGPASAWDTPLKLGDSEPLSLRAASVARLVAEVLDGRRRAPRGLDEALRSALRELVLAGEPERLGGRGGVGRPGARLGVGRTGLRVGVHDGAGLEGAASGGVVLDGAVPGGAAVGAVEAALVALWNGSSHAGVRGESQAEAVASVLGISVRQLSRVLGAAGTSLPQVAQAVRVREAVPLVLGGTEPLAAIAAAVGFRSPEVFSRAYNAQRGVSPSQDRRRSQRGT